MPPENSPPPSMEPPLKQIRTFQGDVAEALGRQKESLVSIQQTEQARRRAGTGLLSDAEVGENRKYTFLLFLGGFFFILMGMTGAWFGYQQYLQKTAPPVIAVPENRFISVENVEAIDLTGATRDTLIATFDAEASGVASGKIKQILTRLGPDTLAKPVETAAFLSILGSRAPGSLVRAFDPLFMLGTFGESRFIIFKLTSFANAFPGMLSWETDIAQDLGPLLSAGGVMKVIDPASVFRDMVIKNKDLRVLESGGSATGTPETALVYSFFDNEMLIISDKIETVQAIIERLTREKLSR